MPGSNPTLQATINQFISDADLAHQFVTGVATDYVTTPNGQYPTLANIAAAAAADLLRTSVISQLNFTTTTQTAGQVVDTFSMGVLRSAKYDVTVTCGTGYQFSTVMLLHDGINVTITEFGRISTNIDQADFDASVDSVNGLVQLLINPTSDNTVVKAVRTVVPI